MLMLMVTEVQGRTARPRRTIRTHIVRSKVRWPPVEVRRNDKTFSTACSTPSRTRRPRHAQASPPAPSHPSYHHQHHHRPQCRHPRWRRPLVALPFVGCMFSSTSIIRPTIMSLLLPLPFPLLLLLRWRRVNSHQICAIFVANN